MERLVRVSRTLTELAGRRKAHGFSGTSKSLRSRERTFLPWADEPVDELESSRRFANSSRPDLVELHGLAQGGVTQALGLFDAGHVDGRR